MLQYELTKKHAGIILWGDPWEFRALHEFIHTVNEESPFVHDKEGTFISLAYDLRKAYEGQRRKDRRVHFDDECPIYGVEMLWPTLLAQMSLLRRSMAFIPTTARNQSLVYSLEGVVESAIREACPKTADEILRLVESIGDNHRNFDDLVDTRSHYFVTLQTRERLKKLPWVLRSMTFSYDILYQNWVNSGEKDAIAPAVFESIPTGILADWPDFEW